MKKEFNEKKIHPVSTAINMFDFEKKDIHLRSWYYDMIQMFEECGIVPTLIEMVKDSPDIEVNRILVKNATKRFEQCNFKGYKGFFMCKTLDLI